MPKYSKTTATGVGKDCVSSILVVVVMMEGRKITALEHMIRTTLS